MEKVNLHIPLKIALYDANGTKQMLQHNGELLSDVLNVTEKTKSLNFTAFMVAQFQHYYVIFLRQ